MKDQIMKFLEANGIATLGTETDVVHIYYRAFYDRKSQFLFQLNAKPIDGCKTKITALKKIDEFLNKGFVFCEN